MELGSANVWLWRKQCSSRLHSQSFATNAHLELLAAGGLNRENSLKVLNWPPTQGCQEMLRSHESEGNSE